MRDIDELLEEIDLNRIDCRDEVDDWAGSELADLRSDILRFERDHAYQRFIRRFIANKYSPEDHDGKPRCTCGNDCPVLEGRLPSMVKAADDPGRAAEEWAIRHPGTPHALLKADDAYRGELASVMNGLHRVEAATRRDRLPASARDDDQDDEESGTESEAEVTA